MGAVGSVDSRKRSCATSEAETGVSIGPESRMMREVSRREKMSAGQEEDG